MRTVLITATYFSDDVFLGCLRMNALVRYLPNYGWRPVVLTPRLPTSPALPRDVVEVVEYPDLRAGYARLKEELGTARQVKLHESGSASVRPSPARMMTSRAVEQAKRLLVPDPSIVWWPAGTRTALRYLEHRTGGVDCVLTSSNPPTPHFIGASLKRRLGIPWVADLRDLWTLNHYWPWGNFRRRVEGTLERRILGSADAVVTLSEDYVKRLRFLHNDARERYHVIPLGYDPAIIPAGVASLTRDFTITFTGNFVEGKRDPALLFDGIKLAIEEGGIDRSRLRVRFYGPRYGWIDDRAARRGIADVVEQYGYVAHEEAIARQRESQVLVLFLWEHPAEAGAYSGKIEFLVAGRPILVLTPPRGGIWEQILEKTRVGVAAWNAREIAVYLSEAYGEFMRLGSVSHQPSLVEIEKYSYSELTRRFATVLDGVIGGVA